MGDVVDFNTKQVIEEEDALEVMKLSAAEFFSVMDQTSSSFHELNEESKFRAFRLAVAFAKDVCSLYFGKMEGSE